MHKLKLLISAYACAPNIGSEPGMGWNFVKGLSAFHELHVIVEKRKWETPINEFLTLHPEMKGNLKFYFIDKKRNKFLRKVWPPSYYWFYRDWQRKAYKLALKLDKNESFDLIHQLNMVGYREPGFLWKINKPFIWGPIGGLENSPWKFLHKLGVRGLVYYAGRNIVNSFQVRFYLRPRKAANHFNCSLIAATPENSRLIKRFWNKESDVICEVGKTLFEDITINTRSNGTPFKIIWSGQHTPGKNLPLLIDSLRNIDLDFELHILGNGEMTENWKKIALKAGIYEQCFWYGWINREKAIEIMKLGHVFCLTSIKDLTSSVLLEAISLGLPVVTLDHCGFSFVVNDKCGIKIPVISWDQAKEDITTALRKLYFNEDYRQKLSIGALDRSNDFNWESKIEKLNRIYASVLK